MTLEKPEWLFDRGDEWAHLSGFVDPSLQGSRLAVLYGRRRQGKTALLEALAEQTGGFYWQARQQSSRQNLASLSAAWASWIRAAVPVRFADWEEACSAMLSAGSESNRGSPILLDEFGYLVDTASELPSVLQAHLTPRAQRTGSSRIVLCGSVSAQMRNLLAAGAPLRGRATLELAIKPFDYRTAARFWSLDGNHDAAFALHALIGGTPAYRHLAGEIPRRGDVGAWVIANLLSPAGPLSQEGHVVVAEDPAMGDRSVYLGVLGAIADGHRRRGTLASALGRTESALTFPLRVLVEGAWIEVRPDPLHRGHSTFLLTEPIVRMHRVLIEPDESRINRGAAKAVWHDAQPRVASLIYGPHLEWMAAEWIASHASAETVGGHPVQVGPSVLRAGGQQHQIDIVATEPTRNDGRRVHLVGEVKAGSNATGVDQLARLDDLVGRLGDRAGPQVKRLLVARRGFTAELHRTARSRPDVELVDLARLYTGD